jgi:hypothetical protein
MRDIERASRYRYNRMAQKELQEAQAEKLSSQVAISPDFKHYSSQ